jgi:uncharacterized protein with NRDE domain
MQLLLGRVVLVCLLVMAWRVAPGEPLIVGANRDELMARPATPITVLAPSDPRILGGRDEQSGGTWLAVNEHGVCAGLTNQPLGDAKDPSKRSRGDLPLALARHASASAAVEALVADSTPAEYNGCWLLVGDRTSLWFVDFTDASGGPARARALAPGFHILENRALGEPSPKVDLVRAALGEPRRAADVDAAFRAVLADHRVPEDDERPNSANCVHLDTFGTRSSCLVRVADRPSVPRMWVAAGPPCTTPYEDVGALWARTGPEG